MVSVGAVLAAVVLGGLALVHVAIAALATRLFRVRLHTEWAPVVYTLLVVPIVYVATSLVVLGVLGVGGTGSGVMLDRGTLLVLLFGLPLALGLAVDFFWMPAPEEVDLPQKYEPDND
jgi:hypothetical protein